MKPFFDSLFNEFSRVIKENGKVYIFCDWRTYAFYYPLLLKHINVRNMLVWDKISGPGSSYTFTHELILFAEKGVPYMKGSNIFRLPGFQEERKNEWGDAPPDTKTCGSHRKTYY